VRRWIVVAVVVAVGIAGAVVGVVFWRAVFVVTRATDVMFVDAQHGWALTTHRCGGGHRCLRILGTADGGRSWQSVGVPPGAKAPLESLPCSHVINWDRPCIEHLTFADARTGYAWSDRLLYVTRDGGQRWSGRNGGAGSLAAADGAVLRTRFFAGTQVVERADAEARDWRIVADAVTRTSQLKLVQSAAQVSLVESQAAYGDVDVPRTIISTTADDGRSWQRVNTDPCPRPHTITTVGVLLAPDGTAVANCFDRSSSHWEYCESLDGARTFGAVRALPAPQQGNPGPLVAVSRSVLLSLDLDSTTGAVIHLYRTADAGQSWHDVGLPAHGEHTMAFATPTFGYAITANYRGVAYTHDAGATWHTAYLP
jgi:photosystem II stability/assembly factor-like uncharacterized protein